MAPSSTSARSKSPGLKKRGKKVTQPKVAAGGDPLSPEKRAEQDNRERLLIAVSLVFPWLVFPIFGVSTDGFVESMYLNTRFAPERPLLLVLLLLVLSTPHVFYAWTWTNSKSWSTLCHSRCLEPYKAFAACAHVIKAFQFTCMFLWLYPLIPNVIEHIQTIHPLKAVLVLQLFVFGQILNVEVYKKIGEAGVYYGTRLGIDVPWVYGFPFSVVPHPQYFGATMSFCSVFLLMTNENTVREGAYLICLAMTVYYAFSSYVEAKL